MPQMYCGTWNSQCTYCTYAEQYVGDLLSAIAQPWKWKYLHIHRFWIFNEGEGSWAFFASKTCQKQKVYCATEHTLFNVPNHVFCFCKRFLWWCVWSTLPLELNDQMRSTGGTLEKGWNFSETYWSQVSKAIGRSFGGRQLWIHVAVVILNNASQCNVY